MTGVQLLAVTLFAGAALSAIMGGAWLIQRRTGRSGWIDTIWSFGVGTVGFVAAVAPLGPQSWGWRQLATATLAAAWSLRLGSHIARRTAASTDDPRYRALMAEWGADAPRRLFMFLQAQAAAGVVLVIAMALAAHNPAPFPGIADWIGITILPLAVLGETVADRQLAVFRADEGNRGRVCDSGLWAWSRHPNYFFEWLGWLAYPILAFDRTHPTSSVAWLAPICMYWVLVHASGIPPLEAHMLRSRGDRFRAYQARTSAFFLWPPGRG
jgi:steroid 5-alpha reductase family enzyme